MADTREEVSISHYVFATRQGVCFIGAVVRNKKELQMSDVSIHSIFDALSNLQFNPVLLIVSLLLIAGVPAVARSSVEVFRFTVTCLFSSAFFIRLIFCSKESKKAYITEYKSILPIFLGEKKMYKHEVFRRKSDAKKNEVLNTVHHDPPPWTLLNLFRKKRRKDSSDDA